MFTSQQLEFFVVGGACRDELMGQPSHDIDFVVLAPSFEFLRDFLIAEGFKIHVEKPEFATIRAGVPINHPLRSLTKDADFVMARRDGPSTDGRRPDFVEPGDLIDDLSRRDFTVNAVAKNALTGEIVDPFDGCSDIMDRSLRFVGDPMTRINEDGLRVLRGFRFMITKGFGPKNGTWEALISEKAAEMLSSVSIERTREELEKMFNHDTMSSMDLLSRLPFSTRCAIFREGLKLTPTLKGRPT